MLRFRYHVQRVFFWVVLCLVGLVSQVWAEDEKPKQQMHVAMRHVEDYGHKGSGVGAFLEPRDLAVDPSGNLLVADTGNHRIVKLNNRGAYLTEVGGFGWDDRQFNEPTGVSAGAGLDIYVSTARTSGSPSTAST